MMSIDHARTSEHNILYTPLSCAHSSSSYMGQSSAYRKQKVLRATQSTCELVYDASLEVDLIEALGFRRARRSWSAGTKSERSYYDTKRVTSHHRVDKHVRKEDVFYDGAVPPTPKMRPRELPEIDDCNCSCFSSQIEPVNVWDADKAQTNISSDGDGSGGALGLVPY